MLKSLPSALLIALAIVTAALLVRTAPGVDAAGGPAEQRVYLTKTFDRDEEKVFGTVPPGKKLLLMDVQSQEGSDRFEVKADGQRVGPEFFGVAFDGVKTFGAGLEIKGGQVFSVRRFNTSSSPTVRLFIGGVLLDE